MTEAALLRDAFLAKDVKNALKQLYSSGVLGKFAPFSKLEGVSQGKYHHLCALEHTFEVVYNAHLYEPENLDLQLAALFHDTGKADTRTEDSEGNVHFIGHELYSVRYLDTATNLYQLETVGFNVDRAKTLIHLHMLETSRITSGSSRRRLRKEVGSDDTLFLLLKLKAADKASGKYPERAQFWLTEARDKFLADIEKEKEFSLKDLAITGKDLVGLGVTEGKVIGDILNYLFNKTASNRDINTREQLLVLAKDYLISRPQL